MMMNIGPYVSNSDAFSMGILGVFGARKNAESARTGENEANAMKNRVVLARSGRVGAIAV
jgi:hypothetical protein